MFNMGMIKDNIRNTFVRYAERAWESPAVCHESEAQPSQKPTDKIGFEAFMDGSFAAFAPTPRTTYFDAAERDGPAGKSSAQKGRRNNELF